MPPLRERKEDIPLLVQHFLKKYSPAAGKSIVRTAEKSLRELAAYEWPGNVRQLENTIERAVALESTDELQVEIPVERSKNRSGSTTAAAPVGASFPAEGLDLENYVSDIERSLLQSALRQSNGVQTRAAEMLKLSYRSFRHLMKKYEI